MQNFYKTYPALKKSPLYIAGESYAGHYVPRFAVDMLYNETFKESTGVKPTGILIGNGWTDPINQINYYDSFLSSVGVVPNKFRDVCTWYQTNGIINIYNQNY